MIWIPKQETNSGRGFFLEQSLGSATSKSTLTSSFPTSQWTQCTPLWSPSRYWSLGRSLFLFDAILQLQMCYCNIILILLLLLIIIIIIIICYNIYAGCLILYIYIKHVSGGIQCCSCSVGTICPTRSVISSVKYVLYLYISTFRSLCAVPNTAAFRSSLIPCFLGRLFG